MAKSTNNAGNAKAGTMEGPAGRRLERNMKLATAKRTTTKTATTTRRAHRATRGKTAGGTAKPAARTVESTAVKRDPATGRRVRERTGETKQEGRQGAGSAPLRPIRQRQTRGEILATVATDSGVERPLVERVARGLAQTLTRHLMRNGSGRVDIPYLGAALWRGREGARKARKMASPILKGRVVTIPAKRATAVARIRVHTALREIVARA